MKSEGDTLPVEASEAALEMHEAAVVETASLRAGEAAVETNEAAVETNRMGEVDSPSASGAAETAATVARGIFEDEEERFFSEPPDAYDETTEPSVEHAAARVDRIARHGVAVSTVTMQPYELEQEPPERAGPALSARQLQLRRRVAGTLCAMLALLLVGFVVRRRVEASDLAHDAVAASPARPTRVSTPAPSSATRAQTIPATIATMALALPPPIASAPVLASAAAAAASAAPIAPPQTALAAEIPAPPSASADPISSPSDEDTVTLVHSARSLLNAGHTREGVSAARQAVEKDPLDAEPYILLAAGLQDLGAWGEARDVFAQCLRKTKHGSSSTCQYFARR